MRKVPNTNTMAKRGIASNKLATGLNIPKTKHRAKMINTPPIDPKTNKHTCIIYMYMYIVIIYLNKLTFIKT
jgi:hypothetical protein